MNFKKAAYNILKKEKKPLSAKEITQAALKEGLITSHGKTPNMTVSAVIYTNIKQKGGESLFVKVKRGFFGLREWGEEIHEKKDKTIKTHMEANLIIELLKEKQFKSDSPTDFEEAIKDSFNFLGFESELIGGSGDTDVLLIANIGKESFKVTVDGKTSKSGKIMDSQIDWISLKDHKGKNKADFVVVVGPNFAGGNLEKRANEYDVSLLKTENLIELIKAHSKSPFTLKELKDLFSGKGDRSTQLDDLLSQNRYRRTLLEQFKIIIKEMESIQEGSFGYFTLESLGARLEKIEEIEIEPDNIKYIIHLLKLPFINGIEEISDNQYILTIKIKDIANIFKQISTLLLESIEKEEPIDIPDMERVEKPALEKKFGSKYFEWKIKEHSVVAKARKDNPYEHYCPIDHFKTILEKIIQAFRSQNIINTDLIFSILEGQQISHDRPFKGKAEEYKIRMALAILELEELIKWTGSKRPIEYKLNVPIERIYEWGSKNIEIKE